MSPRRTIDWTAVRSAYERGTLPVAEIARRHGLSRPQVHARALRDGWTMRATHLTLARRLQSLKRSRALIEQQIAALELDAAGADDSLSRVRALTHLVKLIEQVSKLERQHAIDSAKRRQKRAARLSDQEMRDAIARRVEGLAAADDPHTAE
ncbi:MAG: hypothetical protein U1E46_01880 [Hyphomicrobiales bacterium]